MTLARSIQAAALMVTLAGIGGLAARDAQAWPWPVVNPEIYNSGQQVTGSYYDPFTGRFVVRTDRTRVRESVLDPWRNQVDPGSKHYVDHVQVDANGVKWRVRGWKWTSNGVPHGDVRRTRIGGTGIPGVDHEENDRVVYSSRQGNNQPGQSLVEPSPPRHRSTAGRPPRQRPHRGFIRPRPQGRPHGGYNPF